MSARDWEKGRFARLAGRTRQANPHRPGKRAQAWLAGWLHQEDRCEARKVDARPEPVRRLHEAVRADEQASLDRWVGGADQEVD